MICIDQVVYSYAQHYLVCNLVACVNVEINAKLLYSMPDFAKLNVENSTSPYTVNM